MAVGGVSSDETSVLSDVPQDFIFDHFYCNRYEHTLNFDQK